MGTKIISRLRLTEAWNRAALWLRPLLYSLYNNDMDRFLNVQRCCHCPRFSSDPSLWLCRWHCSHFKYGWKSATPTEQICWLYTFQRAQAEHWQNKSYVLLQQENFWIPTFTYDGTPLELVTEYKYLGITLTRDGSMLTAAKKMADNFRSAIARVYKSNWW